MCTPVPLHGGPKGDIERPALSRFLLLARDREGLTEGEVCCVLARLAG